MVFSRRETDMAAESVIADFLDENLYANLLKEGKFTSIYREYSRERQLQGIDVTVNSRSSSVNIDEKAQLY